MIIPKREIFLVFFPLPPLLNNCYILIYYIIVIPSCDVLKFCKYKYLIEDRNGLYPVWLNFFSNKYTHSDINGIFSGLKGLNGEK